MRIKSFVFNPFGENTFVVWDENSLDAAIIDPGCYNTFELETLVKFIEEKQLHVLHILNTHMHIDHSAGNYILEEKYGVKTACNTADNYLSTNLTQQAIMFGFPYSGCNFKISNNVVDGQHMTIAGQECIVLQIPGHTKGHVAYYFPNEKVVFSGDAIFRMSIGRTDFPGGNYQELIESIEEKLLTLPRDTDVLPGHGESTTVEFEQTNNPYL